jgi:hypothetical protein
MKAWAIKFTSKQGDWFFGGRYFEKNRPPAAFAGLQWMLFETRREARTWVKDHYPPTSSWFGKTCIYRSVTPVRVNVSIEER